LIKRKILFTGVAALLLLCAQPCRSQSSGYDKVKSKSIFYRLQQYRGDNADREVSLVRLFEGAGCRDENLRIQPVEGADAPNVICTLPGATDTVIVVGAHFDRVAVGDGVADNWSGASLLPSLYQSLSTAKREDTFVFIGFSDEEKGYVGSKYYVDHLTEEGLASIRAMVCLDSLGLNSTRVWASDSSPDLVALVQAVAAAMRLPIDVMNVEAYGNSDGKSFKERGVPILTLHSVTPDNIGILHTEKDSMNAIEKDAYIDTYNLVAAFLAKLDLRGGQK
jgi:hypothetical protein